MSTAFSVYVGNVPARIHWRWVKSLFSGSLKVTDVFLSRNPGSNGSKFGFVRFRAPEEAAMAINRFNGFKVLRSNLRVAVAKERKASHLASKLKSSWCLKNPFPICSAVVREGESPDTRFPTSERFVWVRCFGLSGKLWNRPTVENLASLWGKLSLLPSDCDNSLTSNVYCFQIQTDHIYRIDDVITVKCGSHSYIVRIEECCECYVRGNIYNGEGPRIQSHQLPTAKTSNEGLENHASVQEVTQNSFGNDPFGLESIIHRLSESRKKKARKKVPNPLREGSEKGIELNCSAIVPDSVASELDPVPVSDTSEEGIQTMLGSEISLMGACDLVNSVIDIVPPSACDDGVVDDESLAPGGDSEEMFSNDLPNYVEDDVMLHPAGDVSLPESTVGNGGSPIIADEEECIVSKQIRKVKRIDPSLVWDFAKGFGCTTDMSDNEVINWIKVLDIQKEKEYNIEFI